MDRYVIMVDAGYLLRRAVEIISQKSSSQRRDIDITDPSGLITLLDQQTRSALNLDGKELLRVYWYDGVMAGGLTPQQRAICELPDVNIRAGLVNAKGQQKGVDSLIVMDLFELASNRAVTDAALITGDSDLAIGIELAQKKGVRVAVLGLEDLTVGVFHGQSREITDRADRVHRFGHAELSQVMKYAPSVALTMTTPSSVIHTPLPVISSPALKTLSLTSAQKTTIDNAVRDFLSQQTSPPAGTIDASTKRIEAVMDRALIHHVFISLGHGALTIPEKNHARACFRKQLGY